MADEIEIVLTEGFKSVGGMWGDYPMYGVRDFAPLILSF